MTISWPRMDSLFGQLIRTGAIALVTGLLIAWPSSAVLADEITDHNVDAALAAATTPADHQALAALFTAKANAALARAKRYESMAYAFPGKDQQNLFLNYRSAAARHHKQASDYAALANEQVRLAGGK